MGSLFFLFVCFMFMLNSTIFWILEQEFNLMGKKSDLRTNSCEACFCSFVGVRAMSSQDQHTIDDLNQLKNTFNHISITI